MIVRGMNAQPVRQLHAGPAEYLWLSTSLGVTSEAVPDLPFCASVACAAPSVDGHEDLPKGGHEVGPVAITTVIGFASRSAAGQLPAEYAGNLSRAR